MQKYGLKESLSELHVKYNILECERKLQILYGFYSFFSALFSME